MTKALAIVETPYRATIEEQDDTVLWLTSMLQRNGIDMTVLLRSSAVSYGVRGHDASGLQIGGVELRHPARLDADIEALLETGVPVYYLQEDLDERGIPEASLVDGIKPVARRDLPALIEGFEQVWHW